MPQKSGMFDSTVDDPREYPAREFAEYFARFLTDGVFNGGQYLQVTATGANSYVSISLGSAWIKGYTYSVYDEAISLVITPSTTLDRIDRIVLRLDTSTPIRAIKAIVKQGTPSANPVPPALTRSGDIWELSLAQVRVVANSIIVTQAKITDERLDQNVCGLVNSLIRVDTATFQQQWDAFLESAQNQGFATPASVDAKITTHNNVTSAHGATSIASANKIIARDDAGRAKVTAPSVADDIARLDTVTNAVGPLANLLTTAKSNPVEAINEVFQSGVNAKNSVVAAVNAKGVATSTSDPWAIVAAKIGQIPVGVPYATGATTASSSGVLTITGLAFQPNVIVVRENTGEVQLLVTRKDGVAWGASRITGSLSRQDDTVWGTTSIITLVSWLNNKTCTWHAYA